MASLRNRIENSRFLAGVLARLAGAYLSFVNRTVRWDVEGLEDLTVDLKNGPVLLAIWHQHSLLAHVHWPQRMSPMTSLYADSPVGRVAGAIQRQAGLTSIEMRDGAGNQAASRRVLKAVRGGSSIGIAVDGPLGPGFEVKDAVLDWARATGRPVWGYAFETSRGRQLSTWDRMRFPYPFGTGRVVFRRWAAQVPRRVESQALEVLREDLASHLNEISKSPKAV